MVNSERGEVELKSRFDDSTHVLSFGPNQMASIEETLKRDLSDIVNDMSVGRISVRVMRTIIRLTYVPAKNAKPLTDQQAGEILNAVGYKPVVDALSEGIKWMRVGMDEAEGAANPTEASGGASE